MRPHDEIDAVHHASSDELPRPSRRLLLGGLEHEANLAGKLVPALGEQLRCAQQHGCVAVVPAGVHHARAGRGELELVLLLDRERIDVGSERQHLSGPSSMQRGDDAGGGRAGELKPLERAQDLLDVIRGFDLLEGELGMGV